MTATNDKTAQLTRLLARAHPDPRRRDGHDDPGPPAVGGRLSRPAACGLHDHPHDLKGDNDLLVADPARGDPPRSTTRFSPPAPTSSRPTRSTRRAIAQADYELEGRVRDINLAAARIARERADAWTAKTPDKPRFVAGALGPTNRTASISPDVNDPGSRNVSYDELVAAYGEAVDGAGRRRRRPAAGRDGLRHAQRQGGAVRDRQLFRRARRAPAAHRVGHDHRRVGAHAVRPDDRGLLELGAPRAAARGRAQLRARRGADAAVHRGNRARRGHVRLVLSRMRGCRTR